MKKFLIFFLVVPLLIASCSGDDGIDGIDGIDGVDGKDGINGIDGKDGKDGVDGIDGKSIIGSVFVVEIDFLPENDFKALVEFPDEIEIDEDMVVVVYMVKNELIAEKSTIPPQEPPLPPLWEAVPSLMFYENETIMYSFKYIPHAISFFMTGTADLSDLPSELTNNLSFKVGILPASTVSSLNPNELERLISSLETDKTLF